MSDRKPQDFDELYPGRFLKAGLFNGKHVTLTITDIDTEQLEEDAKTKQKKGKKKAILSFKESEMQLVCVKTNGQCLKAMFGRKLKDWIGKRVTLYSDKDMFGREEVDAVRVWGSPDIDRDFEVTIDLGPRRKPKQRVLHAVQARGQTRNRQPTPDTGEVAPEDEPQWNPDDDGR